MPRPPLLLSVEDGELQRQLEALPALKRFKIIRPDTNKSWVACFIQNKPQIAIVQADNYAGDDHQTLTSSGLLATQDVIMVSGGQPNEFIDQAMINGVSYHFRQPLDFDYLGDVVEEIYQEIACQEEASEQVVSSDLDQFGLLVGSSGVMRRLYRVIRKAAESEANVFIIGESGAGKELVANTVHLFSHNANKPFIALNCGALSPELIESELFGHVKGAFTGASRDRAGVFEQAEGGTLFLDEVTEMPLDHQVKLLRVLETGEYRPVGSEKIKRASVRVISATNRDPAEAIRDELFREDLYFRLAHFPIRVPPLRDRKNDIVGLAKHFLAYRNTEENAVKEISVEALDKIANYSWPGNVRELKHAIERAYILADDIIGVDHLILEDLASAPASHHQTLPSGIPLEEVEKGVILKTLERNNGNKTETADQLGISVKTLYNKLEKYQSADVDMEADIGED